MQRATLLTKIQNLALSYWFSWLSTTSHSLVGIYTLTILGHHEVCCDYLFTGAFNGFLDLIKYHRSLLIIFCLDSVWYWGSKLKSKHDRKSHSIGVSLTHYILYHTIAAILMEVANIVYWSKSTLGQSFNCAQIHSKIESVLASH